MYGDRRVSIFFPGYSVVIFRRNVFSGVSGRLPGLVDRSIDRPRPCLRPFRPSARQVLPIERGGGVDQKLLLDFSRRLANGGWCHIFPEGKTVQVLRMLPLPLNLPLTGRRRGSRWCNQCVRPGSESNLRNSWRHQTQPCRHEEGSAPITK